MAEEFIAYHSGVVERGHQISATVDQINRGSQQQTAATQQTSAALAQIEKSARPTQERGRLPVGRTSTMEKSLKRNARALTKKFNPSARHWKKRQRQSGNHRLCRQSISRKIQKNVDAITLATIQTTMLAVSGAVEAARAGDAGRGFPLVSNDIRSLAREASESVEHIKGTIRSILEQISILRRDIEQIITAGNLEVQNNRAVIKTLEDMTGEIVLLENARQDQSTGSGRDPVATGETAAAPRQITTAAEEASSASRQAASASAEQAQGANDLAAAIEEIASLSEEVKSQNG